ncbi:HEPN domain-containing protein [Nesterenkonia cremea]|nr:HEPN domain-containing protein [Nesterenkonia cremea]
MPRQAVTETGWPAAAIEQPVVYGEEGLVAWSAIVHLKSDAVWGIPARSIPEVRKALDWAVARFHVPKTEEHGLPILYAEQFNRSRESWWQADFLRLILEVIQRAEATQVDLNGDFADIYRPLERARLDTSLPCDLLVPIPRLEFDDPLQIEMEEDVSLVPIEPEMQLARAPLVEPDGHIGAYRAAAATHALRFKDVVISNENYMQRMVSPLLGDDILSIQQIMRIDAALQAVSIGMLQPYGYQQVVVVPDGWSDGWRGHLPSVLKLEVANRAEAGRWHFNPWRDPTFPWPNEIAERIPGAWKQLTSERRGYAYAGRRLQMLATRDNEADRILDCVSGLEAVLMRPRDRSTGERFALRAAARVVGGNDCDSPEALEGFWDHFERAEQLYKQRNKIVHGGHHGELLSHPSDDMRQAAHHGEFLLRWTLGKLVPDEQWVTAGELHNQGIAMLEGTTRSLGSRPDLVRRARTLLGRLSL